jgi:hypothetical protein
MSVYSGCLPQEVCPELLAEVERLRKERDAALRAGEKATRLYLAEKAETKRVRELCGQKAKAANEAKEAALRKLENAQQSLRTKNTVARGPQAPSPSWGWWEKVAVVAVVVMAAVAG